MQKIRKAIIPAAGLGTRFLPATKAQPKEMLPIVDKPAIQFIIEEAIDSGIEDHGREVKAVDESNTGFLCCLQGFLQNILLDSKLH